MTKEVTAVSHLFNILNKTVRITQLLLPRRQESPLPWVPLQQPRRERQLSLSENDVWFSLSWELQPQHVLVEINEFNHAHFCVVAKTMTGLDNTKVATGTVCYFLCDNSEELLHGVLILEIAEHETAICHIVLLRPCDQRLSEHAESLGLSHSRKNSLMLDKSYRKVRKKCLAVSFLATEVVEFFIMSHGELVFI